jgi:Homeodomain-like domain
MPRLEHKYHVVLTDEARAELEAITRMHTVGAAKLRRAKILLMSADGCTDMEISDEVGLCERQVVRVRQKFVKSGVQPALTRATRKDAGVPKVIDGRAEAQLVTIACSTPPEGRDHWTLQMLCGEMKRQKIVKSVCPETVRQALKKTSFVLGPPSDSASPKKIEPASSSGWNRSSMSTKKRTTKSIR